MSAEIKSPGSVTPEPQPASQSATVPMWIFVLMLVLISVGGLYFDRNGGWFDRQVYGPYASADSLEMYQPKSGAAAMMARGKVVYEQACGICHGVDGMGKPGQAPPLSGSEYVNVTGHERLVRIPLAGISGPLQVQGKDWNMAMAAMGAALPDADLAAALSYIRSSWANKAPEVPAEEVTRIRADLGAHPTAMTSEHLKSMPQ